VCLGPLIVNDAVILNEMSCFGYLDIQFYGLVLCLK
jgi:hypothetical protein